ncbi:ribonuclease P protein component [Sphingobacterium sp. SYP-B4668]|uniref:ribonuclease P protein component n=1 Tax=Sphingobacterium sp. SYP-B4668 TaxID=2996035 RepID=UPI0022DD0388|nr:ribonuclease P protein component [Sphingobacterium sp. SYP-B4668]
MENFTFKKEERLCSKRLIDSLFHNGSSFVLYPFRIVFWVTADLDATAQVIISVPKRRFKKAVSRNLLKRRIREAYRLQKQANLYAQLPLNQGSLLFAIQYVGKTTLSFTEISAKLGLALQRMQHESHPLYLAENN